ncbi:MAG: AzlD domain-containing protein [Lachnospiraceae bacterium]|nr:AzlD domain-containing protein [Lachnospiraceae bacterium]
MNNTQILLTILVSAAITICLRAAPFVFLGRKGELGPRVRSLGNMLPAAIMATLVVYCLKTIPTGAWGENLITIVGVAATALVHIWKKNTILSITVGTVLYMILVHIL